MLSYLLLVKSLKSIIKLIRGFFITIHNEAIAIETYLLYIYNNPRISIEVIDKISIKRK